MATHLHNTEGMTPEEIAELGLLTRREAIRRVTALLGGAVVGGSLLLTACERGAKSASDTAATGANSSFRDFTPQEIAYLDEIAETILPETSTPGAKAAKTGAFMALMVKDTYDAKDQKVFRDGMSALDEESRKGNGGKTFMQATPQQRLALLERVDREAKQYMDRRDEAQRRAKQGSEGDKYLNDQRQENAPSSGDVNPAPAITADAPTHWFRMMKELAMLGYFTSEIGMTQAQRYVESPGRFDPCVPYAKGEKAWAGHA